MADVMDTRLKVPPELEGAGPKISGVSAELGGILAQLKTLLAPLDQSWTGSGRIAYGEYQQEWDTAATGLFGTGDADNNGKPDGVLPQIAKAATIAWENYKNCETGITSGWRHN
ncbi:WXG100 family type VII secretion target [Dactylosporangium sp. CA-092794]|uniref:WXG100 family type VII secretion target n=1 Tax=Dactylosporangium sp. CA-092794 TaxID=3239929 RepID=UPI003D94BD35